MLIIIWYDKAKEIRYKSEDAFRNTKEEIRKEGHAMLLSSVVLKEWFLYIPNLM